MLALFSNLAEILAGLIRAGKWPVLVAFIMLSGFGGLAIAGKRYVDEKHEGIKSQVEANEKQSQQMIATLTVMQNTLANVSESIKDVKDAVKVTDQTVRETQKTVIDIYKSELGR